MPVRNIFLYTFLICLTVQGSLFAQTQSSPPISFQKQVGASCQGTLRMEKSVQDVRQAKGGTRDTKTYTLNCEEGNAKGEADGKATTLNLYRELVYAFEVYHDSPYQKDYFKAGQSGDTLVAVRKPESKHKTPLLNQKILWNEQSGVLRYVESHLLKVNFLYDMKVDVKVWFDENGLYSTHEIEIWSKISLKDPIHTFITGRVLP